MQIACSSKGKEVMACQFRIEENGYCTISDSFSDPFVSFL